LGPPVGIPPAPKIDPEIDYFSYHQPFWVYLFREEGVAFNDLTSEEAHVAFERFVNHYNTGALEAAYYGKEGFPLKVLDECRTTRHKWSFQTSATERRGLEQLQEGVRKQTEYVAPEKQEGPGTVTVMCPKAV
jgi:hypothetical protein